MISRKWRYSQYHQKSENLTFDKLKHILSSAGADNKSRFRNLKTKERVDSFVNVDLDE